MLDIKDIENKIINADCMDILKQLPDKCIDLVLTDPPYGIGAGSKKFINGTSKTNKIYYKENDWDILPQKEVFDEIFRISKNQIIFGGNYFLEYLKNTRGFLVWDKTIHGNSYADCEFIWTSFDQVARIKYMNICEADKDGRNHPTQKPIKLIQWCIKYAEKYLNEKSIILDCFSGSGTTAIACHNLKRRFICIEKDKDYWKASVERLKNAQAQLKLF
jgi:site-specific DNA-methyltransferase (adenine-specific)